MAFCCQGTKEHGMTLCIMELVDSICRDSADTQYMLMQKILKISRTCYILVPLGVLFIMKTLEDEQ